MKFEISKLAQLLKDNCPEVSFALLHGSAKEGNVKAGSDIDLALYINAKPSLGLYKEVMEQVDSLAPKTNCDIGILNDAEAVYRFEALKGNLLFARDQEKYLHFFSLTCREYESQMADYQRQQNADVQSQSR